MAKRFFYVCGGLLMLTIAWHLGATSVQGQAVSQPGPANIERNGPIECVVGRSLWVSSDGEQPCSAPIPGSSPIIAVGGAVAAGGFRALLENGDFYFTQSGLDCGPWIYGGNIFGASTSAQSSTWGQLKARYR
jgi:hypothetical protein